jgi:hypothetical protein
MSTFLLTNTQLWHNFKYELLYSSNTSWKYIILGTFEQFLSHKVRETPVFGAVFVIFGRLGAYLPPLTPSTTTPCPGTTPANSRRTKQFLSRILKDLTNFIENYWYKNYQL